MADVLSIGCTSCGTINRVPREKLGQGREPICGRCKAPLSVNAKPEVVTDATFSDRVEHSPLPALLDMWAPWCGPCRIIAPVVEQLATEMAGRLRVGKLNVDENPRTAERFDIRGIPALLVFKEGREIDRIVGVQPKTEIMRRVERAISGT